MKKAVQITVALSFIFLVSCSAAHKKRKCADCPKFSKMKLLTNTADS